MDKAKREIVTTQYKYITSSTKVKNHMHPSYKMPSNITVV